MKKYFVFILMLFFKLGNAQYVTLPDENFSTWLYYNGFSACLNQERQLDTTCSEILEDSLGIDCSSSSIIDITGIQYFKGLIYLNCSSNSLTFLPPLPSGIQTLVCNNNQIGQMFHLPEGLQTINCAFNQITNIASFPSSLINFTFQNNQLDSIPTLPMGVKYLVVSYNNLKSLPLIPDSLIHFDCSHNQISVLSSLPNKLFYFDCSYNQLTNLPFLPNSLSQIICTYNQLTSVPSLPDSLYDFYCNHNLMLSCLPELKTIRLLDFDSTDVKCVLNYGDVASSIPLLNNMPLCSVSNPNGCIYSSITEINGLDFSVSPNPSSSEVVLSLNEVQDFSLYVMDITGREIINTKILVNNYQLSVSQLPDGIYFVRVSDGLGGVGVRKFVKQ